MTTSPQLLPEPHHSASDERLPVSRRNTVMSVTGLLTSALIATLSIVPAPYAVGAPGPTYDTLGELQGIPLVSVGGAETFEASGELRLTTVAVSRGGSRAFTLGRVIQGWYSPGLHVVPEETVFGTRDEQEFFDEYAQQQWVTSQERATVSALEVLGIPVPAELRVAGLSEGSNAEGLLEEDDYIREVGGRAVTSYAELVGALEPYDAGDAVELTIERAGAVSTVAFELIENEQGNPVMGVFIDPQFDVPVDVTVAIDRVGGSSAGLMFSLAIIDKLTEVDELAGARVAGTGEISVTGDVNPIGGIRLKMHGARDAGSDYFLAPIANCDEVTGHIPRGLHVVAVETLDDAYEAIVSIGQGRADELPTC